jgi:hypothetical protein
MKESYCQQVLDLISTGSKVLVLVEKCDDPLSLRARHILHSSKIKLENLGFTLLHLTLSEESQKVKELACLKVPQIRIFKNKKLTKKYVGLPSEDTIKEIVSNEV